MRILVVGGGGREHALCWAISASPLCTKLYCAPGNAGIAEVAECVDVGAEDIPGQVALAQKLKIDFVVIAPDAPLVAGMADAFATAGIRAWGPTKAAARLEGSKSFTKELCRANNIPTAAYEHFTDPFKAPMIDLGFSTKGMISATGLPFLVTMTRSCLAATSSSTPKNFALHSDAFMVFVMAGPAI